MGVRIVTSEEMREIDRITMEEYGMPGEILMGNAGRFIADTALEMAGDDGHILIAAGPGNNGGDGFSAAWYLAARGSKGDPAPEIVILLCVSEEKIRGSAHTFFMMCRKLGLKIVQLDAWAEIDFNSLDLIIDALLGIGVEGRVRPPLDKVVRRINESGVRVLSADIPSGLPSEGPLDRELETVEADVTVTMGLPKYTLVTWPGKRYCGQVLVADIGFPSVVTGRAGAGQVVDAEYVSRRLEGWKEGDPDTHKGEQGRLMIIGGFTGMEGALILTAKGALRTGVGLCYGATTEESRIIVAGHLPELITISLSGSSGDEIHDLIQQYRPDVIVTGPGMGRKDSAGKIFRSIMLHSQNLSIALLVDGDGLYHLSELVREKKVEHDRLMITPHFGEASRLLGQDVEILQQDRVRTACDLSGVTGGTTLLKGPASIITDGNEILVNTTGNADLATGGSGDVLSGIAGALLAGGIPSMESLACAAWLHGKAAENHASEEPYSALPSGEIPSWLRLPGKV